MRCFIAIDIPEDIRGELADLHAEWLKQGQNSAMDMNGDGIVNFLDYALLAKRGYILVVEGAIPTGANGAYCEVGNGLSMIEAMRVFGRYASVVIAVGTCASYGGISAGSPNPTGALGVTAAMNYLNLPRTVINIPGCPAHPDWLVGTIVHLLTNGTAPALDSNGRPTQFYGTLVHTACPNLSSYNSSYSGEAGHANNRSCLSCHSRTDGDVPNPRTLGTSGCLFALGCRGRVTRGDCPTRKWNNPAANTMGVNWCVEAGSPCYGCTEPNFPDGMTPFYTLGD